MRITSVLAVAVLAASLTAGCSKSKEQQLVGHWSRTTNDSKWRADIALNGDQTFSMTLHPNSTNLLGAVKVLVSGTWKVNGDDLIWTVTYSTWEKDKLTGLTDSQRITALDSNSVRTEDKQGRAVVYLRTP